MEEQTTPDQPEVVVTKTATCPSLSGASSCRCAVFPEIISAITQDGASQSDNAIGAFDSPVHIRLF